MSNIQNRGITHDHGFQSLPFLIVVRPLAEPLTEEEAEDNEDQGCTNNGTRSCDVEPLHPVRESTQCNKSCVANEWWERYDDCSNRFNKLQQDYAMVSSYRSRLRAPAILDGFEQAYEHGHRGTAQCG